MSAPRPVASPARATGARRGFTLIEVLIAIVLVAVVLPVALAGVSRALQAAGQVRRLDLARHLAESRLATLVATGDWQSGANAGDFDPRQDGELAAGFHWQMALTPWRDPAVRVLRLTVSWDPPAESHAVTLETLVTPPLAAAAGAP